MQIVEFVLHLDSHLASIVNQFGTLTYFLLFLVIFAETGFVIAPFLPGDSLLFAVGTLAARGIMNIWLVYVTFLLAAILGDTVNYWIGHMLGPKVFTQKDSRIFNKIYLAKTEAFFEKHGAKTIILARFLPIIRTFAPFVAGVGQMHYRTFLMFNAVGGFLWVSLFLGLGYWFGGIEIIKNNFELAVVGIVLFSLLPIAYEYIKHKRNSKLERAEKETSYKDIKKVFQKKN